MKKAGYLVLTSLSLTLVPWVGVSLGPSLSLNCLAYRMQRSTLSSLPLQACEAPSLPPPVKRFKAAVIDRAVLESSKELALGGALSVLLAIQLRQNTPPGNRFLPARWGGEGNWACAGKMEFDPGLCS